MKGNRSVIAIQSYGRFPGGEMLYWLFSKNQLELVLKEIEPVLEPPANSFCDATVAWNKTVLPVVTLEKYYGITRTSLPPPAKYLLLKGAQQENRETRSAMIVIPVFADLKIGQLNFSTTAVASSPLRTNSTDILGSYMTKDGKIIVIPDICKIASRSARLITQGEG